MPIRLFLMLSMTVVAAGRESLHEESLQSMEIWQESVRQFTDPSTSISFFVNDIDLAEGTNALCKEASIDLVVMGITGKSNLEKILIGSNAVRLIADIQYPLLIVPKNTPDRMPAKVVLTTDLKEVKEKISSSSIFKFLDAIQAKLLVVNVARKDKDVSHLRTEIMDLHSLLDRYTPEIHYINHPDTIEAIDEFAQHHQAGIVITFHEQQNRPAALFHKSVSKKLAWHSRLPLLVIPL